MHHFSCILSIVFAAILCAGGRSSTAATGKPVVSSRSDKTSSIYAWPISLDIEIDTLEIGGVSLPWTESRFQNLDVGARNFGNINSFGTQKAISSDQYFGLNQYDSDAQAEAFSRLQTFSDATCTKQQPVLWARPEE
ncbi:hypothetical protein BGZ70_008628 [Mortierella alpina]|uniref:Uncharacterized protein n=1 Tax=Mortierella alpina TaxID=64518 RepID=A0A9P6J3P7_MORAP|nr:hypothetical protein BGZ70_008628 [Mortierella alpina]